jgi:hypothetical protein
MPRTLLNIAGALACATLLVACDKPQPPSVPAAAPVEIPAPPPVTDVADLPKAEEPAATAEVVSNATPEMAQVHVLHVAKEGEESLASLKSFEGKYRWDGVDYLKQGVLAQRLKALTGAQYETLLKNLQTVGPLEVDDGMLRVSGNRQHMGGEEVAAVVIDPARNGLRVWLLSEGKNQVFTDVDGADIPWPSGVQAMIKNVLQAPAS